MTEYAAQPIHRRASSSRRQAAPAEAWQVVIGQLREEMSRANFETWVQPLQPISYREGVFQVGAANSYARDWVESRLRAKIAGILQGVYSESVAIKVVVNNQALPDASFEIQPPASEPKTTRSNALPEPEEEARETGGSPRKVMLQRAYGSERARVIQPERGMFLTMYFFSNWLPLLGHSAAATVMAARSMCYWNPLTGELRNTVETDMSELARRAAVSLRTVKDVLSNDLIKRYFLRYKVRRVMTQNGVRTAGIVLQVRMDDPVTPEDQDSYHLTEDERWYTADFDDETGD